MGIYKLVEKWCKDDDDDDDEGIYIYSFDSKFQTSKL